ncbi:MAG: hypothetical protein RMJ56_10215 [Gemmataceae bacterium]|nr:hypothetical protein [Gemmata sp.]MDW8197964.1 hypothetical protein [Gemmataceae bacterium]
MMRGLVVAVVAVVADAPGVVAQTVTLAETAAAGDCFHYHLELDLRGQMLILHDGSKHELRLEAKARHSFSERTLAVVDGWPARSARYYTDAVASAVVDVEKMQRTLPADRRLVAVLRRSEGPLCFCPAGPLTRDELDLVTEHFNPQCLAGLLPGKPVQVGDTWNLSPAAVQAACLFDRLVKHDLTGQLKAAANGQAEFSLAGTAEGIEHGAVVKLAITATGTFDLTTQRITTLTWKQKDQREQGPIAPASRVEVTLHLKRQRLANIPQELDDNAVAAVPSDAIPATMTQLRHDDPHGRYSLVYPRDWHITGQTEQHLILRLLDRGEFIAQATVLAWKKAPPGQHTPAHEFQKAVQATPGWVAKRVLEDRETTTADGRWLYKIVAEGTTDDVPVLQSFYLLAGPQGDQVALTVAMKPERAKAVGSRDRELIEAIRFPAKK